MPAWSDKKCLMLTGFSPSKNAAFLATCYRIFSEHDIQCEQTLNIMKNKTEVDKAILAITSTLQWSSIPGENHEELKQRLRLLAGKWKAMMAGKSVSDGSAPSTRNEQTPTDDTPEAERSDEMEDIRSALEETQDSAFDPTKQGSGGNASKKRSGIPKSPLHSKRTRKKTPPMEEGTEEPATKKRSVLPGLPSSPAYRAALERKSNQEIDSHIVLQLTTTGDDHSQQNSLMVLGRRQGGALGYSSMEETVDEGDERNSDISQNSSTSPAAAEDANAEVENTEGGNADGADANDAFQGSSNAEHTKDNQQELPANDLTLKGTQQPSPLSIEELQKNTDIEPAKNTQQELPGNNPTTSDIKPRDMENTKPRIMGDIKPQNKEDDSSLAMQEIRLLAMQSRSSRYGWVGDTDRTYLVRPSSRPLPQTKNEAPVLSNVQKLGTGSAGDLNGKVVERDRGGGADVMAGDDGETWRDFRLRKMAERGGRFL